MEKIVQLSDSEYEKLFQLANMNEKLIQKAAEERWVKCPAQIDVYIKINNDCGEAFKIRCNTHLRSDFFEIPYATKKRISRIIQKRFRQCIEEHYRRSVEVHFEKALTVIKEHEKEQKVLKEVQKPLWIILAIAALAFVIITIFLNE